MKKVLRVVAAILIFGALLSLFALSRTGDKLAGKVWDTRTTVGSMNAKHHYIMYTDLACPYCNVFSRQIMENKDEFMSEYVEGKDILFEVRLTNFLKKFSGYDIGMSQWSAEGAYCARNQDRFWDYYYAGQQALWDDYYSKGIGISKTAPKMENMTEEYWLIIGQKLGLGEEFEKCYTNHETAEELDATAEKVSRMMGDGGGMPYFKFGKFTQSGFDPSWGWEYVKQYLDAGLK